MSVKPGKYIGRVVDYGIGTTKNGDPQVMVQFRFEDSDHKTQQMTWFGSLKQGQEGKKAPREITIDALLACGLATDEIESLANGPQGCALDEERDVQLTIEEETDDKGKVRSKIRWINIPGGAAFRDKLSFQDARIKLGALNLKGDVKFRRQQTGITNTHKPPTDTAPHDDLPF